MRLLRRIRNIIASNLNEMVAKAENPEKLLKQCISDMQDQAAKARAQVAHALAAEKKLARQVAAVEAEAERAAQAAAAAAAEAADDAARDAVRRQLVAERRAQALHAEWNRQLESVGALKQALAQLEAKIDEARRRKDVLVARKRLAQAKRDVHSSLSGIAETHAYLDSQAFEAFERVAERVDATEAEAEAAADMCLATFPPTTGHWSPGDISAAEVDAALAALRSRAPDVTG